MPRISDQEAEALDIYYTENTILPKIGSPGLFAQQKAHMVVVDDLSAKYLATKATAEHTTVSKVISDLIRRELTAV